jgi:hypothetical protein
MSNGQWAMGNDQFNYQCSMANAWPPAIAHWLLPIELVIDHCPLTIAH